MSKKLPKKWELWNHSDRIEVILKFDKTGKQTQYDNDYFRFVGFIEENNGEFSLHKLSDVHLYQDTGLIEEVSLIDVEWVNPNLKFKTLTELSEYFKELVSSKGPKEILKAFNYDRFEWFN